jgi:transposase
VKCQSHAIVADHGLHPPASDMFGIGGRSWLEDVELPPASRSRILANLRLVDALGQEIEAADRELRTTFRGDPRVGRLMAIPSIGFTSAAVVTAEVWDVSRFPSPEKLCSWAGLTPSERSSAESVRRGHISKQGSRWLRWILVEAAASGPRDPVLGAFSDRIARRRGTKIARVALARRLLTLCFYALRDETGCRAFPVAR